MKYWMFYPMAATALTAVLYFFVDIPLGYSALMAFLGWPIIGTVITSDDDLPGGFSNPDGTATPDWETPAFWGRLCGGGAVVCIAFLVQLGLDASSASGFVPAAALLALVSFVLLRRSRRVSKRAD